jgi:hypothetical protein
MTIDKRLNDAQWLAIKASAGSPVLYMSALALGLHRGAEWQAFKAKYAGTTHYDLCVLQGKTPLVKPTVVVDTVDNRKVESSVFASILAKEFRAFKSEMKDFVRKEVARQSSIIAR